MDFILAGMKLVLMLIVGWFALQFTLFIVIIIFGLIARLFNSQV